MNVCSFTELREHLRERLDEVHESRTPLLVTRQGAASAVVLDKDEYDGIMETLHLLRSPKNAERLLQAIADLDAGNTVTHDLIDP
jgi:antitoxin YefM